MTIKKTNTTLKELAKILEVSVSTVSKALNDSYEISSPTIKKVKELAKKYNYQPNRVALNLKTGKTKTIAVLIPSIQNYFFAEVLKGIENELSQSSYNFIVSLTNESLNKEVETIKNLSNGIVDGFIVALAEETQVKQSFNHLKVASANGKEIVMFDRTINSNEFNNVVGDDFNIIYKLTKDLIKKNKGVVALVSTISNTSVGKQRKEGYLKAILENFKEADSDLIIEDKPTKIKAEISQLLNSKKVDAIISLDEESSLSTHKILRQRDNFTSVHLVGYVSKRIALNLELEMAVIDQQGIEVGKVCAELLLKQLQSNSIKTEAIIVESKIL